MKLDSVVLWAILLGGLVTWVPRILPFILTQYKGLPQLVLKFLHYLPISIIFALTLSSLLVEKTGHLPQLKWADFLAVFPSLFVALRSQNILWSVLTGVVCVAVFRLIL
ncbi:AzlD domain-containing protein [Streptococcus sp. DD12]|uniref:AzlD domain-containing protein n=1 Tax=Streptococcus sp. DD12 TaxID=1777880 RepID=UPI00079A98A5|nr:AzlD domain-containing protein [Streptococcus sp. DD12]KXT75564.1 hypothetical protein STRDD12_01375 [Streptococcus sp. DD12]